MTPRRSARLVLPVVATAGLLALAADPAGACGGLIGENGTIQLTRTTTLAAYHDGIERYVTSFEFTGEGEELGSIVPLPDVPSDVVRGGDWTLQRLRQEVAPPQESLRTAVAEDAAGALAGPEVLLETKIDALDITVLRGGGDEVGRWAVDHGFLLTPDAPEVLDFYSSRSQVFMAARFDAGRAAELGQQAGDGTPIMLTIPTDQPWVPLRILGLGLDGTRTVEADVFLLTDDEPELLAGGPGLRLERSEPASTGLLDDLRSDVGMEWVPEDLWLTYLQVDTPAADLDYDLAVSAHPDVRPSRTDTGAADPELVLTPGADGGLALWPLALGGIAAVGVIGIAGGLPGRTRRTGTIVTRRARAALAAVIVGGLTTGSAYAVDAAAAGDDVLGPGVVRVDVGIHHSRFSLGTLRVREGTLVELTVRNDDPIGHELVVGDAAVHRAHEEGRERRHPPRPGEVSVGPGAEAMTFFTFDEPGTYEYACHLPGHVAFGMVGEIEVVPND